MDMSHLKICLNINVHHGAKGHARILDFELEEVADDLLYLAGHLKGTFAHRYAVRSTRSFR